ncbi:hypothetical protein [Rhodococcus qingshengii]|uniref:hypothetical protein n=1 Tax=Rhodococcus qingshengii TaxID=334542 RepID=UPI00287F6FD0|nr:hypothetical protein [Rhodococcus qingshengii]
MTGRRHRNRGRDPRRPPSTGVGVAGAVRVGVGLGAAITRRDGRLDENRTVTSSVRAEFGQLPPDDAAVLANADRGFIGTLESPKITAPDGHTVYDTSDYDFLPEDVPETAQQSVFRSTATAAPQRHCLSRSARPDPRQRTCILQV